MSYTATINGYPNQTTEIVYTGYHTLIDNSSTYTTKIRAAIPKYSEITKVLASTEFEKGYSWANAKGWFATDTGTQIGSKHSLSNGANTGKTTDVTSYFQSKTANSGEFVSGTSAIRAYFDGDTVPVTFVTRDKCLIYTYNKPVYHLTVKNSIKSTGYLNTKTSAILSVNGTQMPFPGENASQSYRYEVNTTNTTVVLSETHEPWEKFLGWYMDDKCLSTNSTYNYIISQHTITSYETSKTIIAKYEKIKYPIIAEDYNGTLIAEGYAYWGETISLSFYPQNPIRKPDTTYHYESTGYSPSPPDTTYYGDVSKIIAQYAAIPHSMSYELTPEGRRHHTCSGCEYNFLERPYDLCQENLFHFSDWAESDCAKVASGDGTMSYNISEGSISIIGSGDFYTAYGGTSNYYTISITPGEEYVLDYSINSTDGKQAFVFFYDETGNAVNGVGLTVPHIGKYDGTPIQFIAPEGASKVCFRFGIRGNSTATIKNISFCNIKNKKIFNEITHNKLRKVYFSDEIVSQPLSPRRRHYNFDNWYTDENYSKKIEFPLYLEKSLTIYTKWIQKKMSLGGDSVLLFFGDKKLSLLLGDQLLL